MLPTKLRRGLARAGRTLLCALALLGGAAISEWEQSGAPLPIAVVFEDELPPPPMLDVPLDLPAAAPSDVPQPAPPRGPPQASGWSTEPLAASMRDGRIITGATAHRLILFTFDDGPDHRYTRGLLDTLDRLEIRAVFFLTARRFEGTTPRERELASLAREIVERGHFAGNHTMDHLQLPTQDAAGLEEQVVRAEQVFVSTLGERPWLVRPPGGARSARIDAYLASRGYTQMLWNIGTGDFQVRTSDDVLRTFQRVLARRELDAGERGGVVLLHDIHAWSVEAFPRIVRWLEERNCSLLADGEELYDFVDDPAVFFARREPGESASELAAPAEPDPSWLAARQRRARARAEARCAQLASR